jgi:hypothetical protein
VHFDEPAGTIRGHPVGAARVPPWTVHVIGGAGRPISTMTPTEIGLLYCDLWKQHQNSRPLR